MPKYTPRTLVRQTLNEFRIAKRSLFAKRRPSQIAFILSEPRVGSNLLLSYLATIPGVAVTEEILNPWSAVGIRRKFVTKAAAFRHIARSMSMEGNLAVAKLMLHHLGWHQIYPVEMAARFPGAKYLTLYRRDLLAQFVSFDFLKRTGIHLTRVHRPSEGQVRIDVAQFEQFCKGVKDKYAEWLSHPTIRDNSLVLNYEELAERPQQIFDEQICPFLRLPNTQVSTTLKKQNDRRLEEVIENYEDLSDILNSDVAVHEIDGIYGSRNKVLN